MNPSTPFVFLDPASDPSAPSLLFSNPVCILSTKKNSQVEAILAECDGYTASGYYVAGYMSYESGYALEPRFAADYQSSTGTDCCWFGVFNEPEVITLETLLGAQAHQMTEIDRLIPRYCTDEKAYQQSVAAILDYIRNGESYQVNLTTDVTINCLQEPLILYAYLREKQPTRYGAVIQTSECSIVSCSPELFFETRSNTIRVKPMKGTSKRGMYQASDRKIKQELATSEKNKAENLMIVDLLRNDLGRICDIGSIRVSSLFDVETHPTVHQMTSAIQGRLTGLPKLASIMNALFPCGSVTGAPKIRAMEIIKELESHVRGVYCGAIGYGAPAMSSSVFSVPIRTLYKYSHESFYHAPVGSGIVADSNPSEEWQECQTKLAYLSHELPIFSLVETFRFERNTFLYLKDHIARLVSSATFFSFHISRQTVIEALHCFANSQKEGAVLRVRMLIDKEGAITMESFGLEQAQASSILTINKQPINHAQPTLYHKTTYKPWYEEALQKIKRSECFDVCFVNTVGHVTEGARSNIFIQKNGVLITPPVEDGLLAGVFRKQLLLRKKCIQQTLTLEDLRSADAVFCGNSVRGLVKVSLQD